MDETSPKKKSVKVSGHLEDKRGFYHIVLSWKEDAGNRGRKSISTGLPVKGNKKRAEEILHEKRKEHEAFLSEQVTGSNLLFADFRSFGWKRH